MAAAHRRAPRPLTGRDITLLKFLAEHRIVRANQVATLLGVSTATARTRLKRLAARDLVAGGGPVYHRQPSHFLIRHAGLRAIGSSLSPPQISDVDYRHDVGLAWVWLAARAGRFGPLREIVSERRMKAHDRRRDSGEEHFAVGRIGAMRGEGHYPDLLLRTASGHTVAVELELSHKGARRLDRIASRYLVDNRIDAVLYLVDEPSVARRIEAAAARAGAADLVHVRFVRWGEPVGPPARPGRAVASRGGRRGAPPRTADLVR
jgi:hypothetical protein